MKDKRMLSLAEYNSKHVQIHYPVQQPSTATGQASYSIVDHHSFQSSDLRQKEKDIGSNNNFPVTINGQSPRKDPRVSLRIPQSKQSNIFELKNETAMTQKKDSEDEVSHSGRRPEQSDSIIRKPTKDVLISPGRKQIFLNGLVEDSKNNHNINNQQSHLR